MCDSLSTPRPLGPLRDVARRAGPAGARRCCAAPPPSTRSSRRCWTRCATRPRVFVVEDLHWADEATLDLVRFLARRIAALPLLLVLSYRDALGRRPSAERRCSATSSPSPDARRLQLTPLSRVGRRRRCSTGTGSTRPSVHRRTAGNPFFVSQILAQPDSPLPESVRDAVLARIAGLAPSARHCLELLSCTPGAGRRGAAGCPRRVDRRRSGCSPRPAWSTGTGAAWRSGTRSPGPRSWRRPHPAPSRRCTRR